MDCWNMFRLVEHGNVVQRVLARAWLDADSGLFPLQNAAQHKVLIEDALAYAEEQTKRYKAMADELAEALRRIADPPLNHASWHGVADQMKSEARDALIKYNATKGEE